jgi:hypothetical protein
VPRKSRQPKNTPVSKEPVLGYREGYPVLGRRKSYALEGEHEGKNFRYQEWFEEPSGKRAAWLEVDLDEWISAFRMAEQAGELVVAEVRFFPKEPEPEGEWIDDPKTGRRFKAQFSIGEENQRRDYGSWSGNPANIPPGGVPARLLRTVRPGAALQLGVYGVRAIPPQPAFEKLAERRHRPKRTKRDPLLLARIAVLHEQLSLDRSRSPSMTAWKLLEAAGIHYTRETVRDLVRHARKSGFLSAYTPRADSTATPKAHDLLAQHGLIATPDADSTAPTKKGATRARTTTPTQRRSSKDK